MKPTGPKQDWQTRYRRMRMVLVLATVVLTLEIVSDLLHSQPYHWLVLFFVFYWVFWLVLMLHARKKARRELQTAPRTGPTFLWQAILILLPVVMLTGLGFYYLQQDRQLAEQEAEERAKVTVQQLALTFSQQAIDQLPQYRNANFELEANWSADIGLSSWQDGVKDESNAWVNVKGWQAAHPELKLADQPSANGLLDAQPGASSPKPYPAAPQPPDWVERLTPKQRQLWRQVEALEYLPGQGLAAQNAITNFINSHPPKGASINAQYHLLRLQARGQPTATAVEMLADGDWGWGDQFTETGLPISQVLCQQAMQRLPDGSGLPYHTGIPFALPHKIAWAINYAPSVFSPRLIAEVERVAGRSQTNADGFTDAFTTGLRGWWNYQERARQVLQAFREQYPTNLWGNNFYPVNTSSGRFLVALSQPWIKATNLPPSHYEMAIFPEAVLGQALSSAIASNPIPVPAYVLARLEIAGDSVVQPTGRPVSTAALPVLAEAPGALTNWGMSTNAYPFRLQLLLADRAGMLAHQRQRTELFGGMIFVSALAAVVGLIAAYRAFRRQQELNELKSNFVSSVSHELRAPIASVRLMAENLEQGKVAGAEKQGAYFQFIGQECRRLSSLIENVLDFSRIEQGRKQYEFEPVNLGALVQQTLTLMEPYAAEKGVRLEREAGACPDLEADGRALQQALVNLIDNAVKHSPRGAVVSVGMDGPVAGSPAGTPVRLWVTDAGPGIPAAEHGKIFERFYRRGSELRRETQGVGIGLSIVKHILEAHGGRVLVDSAPGRGSRFTLVLPPKARTGDRREGTA